MIDRDETLDRIVNREIHTNCTYLINTLLRDPTYAHDMEDLYPVDDEGNEIEVFQYFIVSPWMYEKLRAKGEIVAQFQDLEIWGRQTCGQPIQQDCVIQSIADDIL